MMKKWIQRIPQILTNLCAVYTCAILIYPVLGAQQAEMRRGWLYEIFLICIVSVLLQDAVFVSGLMKRLSYLWKMVIFFLLILLTVAVCALAFQWFPVDQTGNWLVFLGCFVAGYLIIALVFEAGFRLRRKVYDDALGRYKQEQKK